MIEPGLKYTETHEWVKTEGEIATVGLSEVALTILGDIVYIELPKPQTIVTRGKILGLIESVKTALDMYAPVSGTVVEVNNNVQENVDLLKKKAYSEGWMVKIKMSDPAELGGLLDADGYKKVAEKD